MLALHGPGRSKHFAKLHEYDLVLSTYALVPRDLEHLRAQAWHVLVLDEAQNIKSSTSKAALAVGELQANQRLCLTGTPMENNLGELWSIFHFLMPGWLGDVKRFNQDYRTPIERHGDAERLAHLVSRVRPFLLRRTKEQVATELPAKPKWSTGSNSATPSATPTKQCAWPWTRRSATRSPATARRAARS